MVDQELLIRANGVLTGSTTILGLMMHVTAVRVKTNDNHIQIADGDPLAMDYYNDLCRLDQRGPFHTTNIEGHDGEWVIFLHPYSRG